MKPRKFPRVNTNYLSRLFHLFAYTINCCCLWVYTWQHLLPFIMLWSVNELATIQWFSPFSQCLFKKKKSQLKNPLILSWKIIVTVAVLTETLFALFTSHEGEMQILLLKTVKENQCLARQDGDTWSLWFGRVICGGVNLPPPLACVRHLVEPIHTL